MRQSVLARVNPSEDSTRRKATMMDVPVSAELRDLLHRKMTCGTTVGADVSQRMKWANDLIDDGAITEDHPPSGGEEFRPNRKLRVRIVRALPFLAVIDGGRG